MENLDNGIDSPEKQRLTEQLELLITEHEDKIIEIRTAKLELTTIEEGIKALELQLQEA